MIGTRAITMPPFLWTHRMSLYTIDPTTGAYTVAGISNQLCRLCETSRKDMAAAPMRAQGFESRTLLYPPSLTVDPLCQVEINSQRYQIASGSDQAARGPSGELVYRSWDLVHVSASGTDL